MKFIITRWLIILLSFLIFSYAAISQVPKKITYLYNSGWLIETAAELILIDYVPADNPAGDSIVFKKLRLGTEAGKKAYIMITHDHHDHFYQPLLNWHLEIGGLTTILGWDYATKDKAIHKIFNRDSLSIGSLKITAHPSTDAGSGFLVSVGDLVFYHAGDHALWSDELLLNYENELKFIGGRTGKIDMIFIPVVNGKAGGCKSYPSLSKGTMRAVQILKPGIVFPMHMQCADLSPYKEFSKAVEQKFPSLVVKAPPSLNYEFSF
jgi:L-ascorbate metabolism protein UlaG (beta-lactamase superfamily)